MIYLSAAMIGGYLLDLLLGDSARHSASRLCHRKLIQICERMTRRLSPDTDAGQCAAGTVTAVLVILITTAQFPASFFYFLWQWNHLIFYCLQGLLFYRMVAVKSLKGESMKVNRAPCRG
jgi:cobalamin biosynthesis protein CobD/CbiB